MAAKKRAPRNRTMDVDKSEYSYLASNIVGIETVRGLKTDSGVRTSSADSSLTAAKSGVGNSAKPNSKQASARSPKSALKLFDSKIIHADALECMEHLPKNFIDLLIVDPPYNLSKQYSTTKFKKSNSESYENWLDDWITKLIPCLKKTATLYVCSDWQSSYSVQSVLQRHFKIQNRITWEREKGRGAKSNWKNCSEDIWFCTVSDDYYFDVDAVKMKRKVIAPYKNEGGIPKDWSESAEGKFRLTHPSNIWNDITIPFWSMPENTDHPTQKSEKLIAKLILASSKKGDFIFDPFLGSGTSCVVAKKLGRKFSGIEREEEYCFLASKRLELANSERSIQGYEQGFFWERNSLAVQNKVNKKKTVLKKAATT